MMASTCLALVIYFEAGIEPPIGQVAVGWSVVTSARVLHRHPHKVCSEARSGRYVAVTRHYHGTLPTGAGWQQAKQVARDVLSGRVADPTGGATNFECTLWAACVDVPWWSVGMDYAGIFGTHRFWRPKHVKET